MEVLGVASVGGLGAFEWVDPGQLMGNLLTKSHGQKCKCLDSMDHFHHLIVLTIKSHYSVVFDLLYNDS